MRYQVILAQGTLANNNFEALVVDMVHQVSLGDLGSRRVKIAPQNRDHPREFCNVRRNINSILLLDGNFFLFQSTQKQDPIAT